MNWVVDGQARRDGTARRVDVEVDVLVGVFRLEEEQLGYDQVGRDVIHRSDEEDDALLEQARIDVVGAFAAPALFDHHGNQAQGLGIPLILLPVAVAVDHAWIERHHAAFPISSSKEAALSVAWTFATTQFTTFSSIASASTCARRCGCE